MPSPAVRFRIHGSALYDIKTRGIPGPKSRRNPGRPASREHSMKLLSFWVAVFAVLTLVIAEVAGDAMTAILGGVALVCALTTFRSTAISSFLKIFVGIFSIETIVF